MKISRPKGGMRVLSCAGSFGFFEKRERRGRWADGMQPSYAALCSSRERCLALRACSTYPDIGAISGRHSEVKQNKAEQSRAEQSTPASQPVSQPASKPASERIP